MKKEWWGTKGDEKMMRNEMVMKKEWWGMICWWKKCRWANDDDKMVEDEIVIKKMVRNK